MLSQIAFYVKVLFLHLVLSLWRARTVSSAFSCIPGLKKAHTMGNQKCVLSVMAQNGQLFSSCITYLSLESNGSVFEQLSLLEETYRNTYINYSLDGQCNEVDKNIAFGITLAQNSFLLIHLKKSHGQVYTTSLSLISSAIKQAHHFSYWLIVVVRIKGHNSAYCILSTSKWSQRKAYASHTKHNRGRNQTSVELEGKKGKG